MPPTEQTPAPGPNPRSHTLLRIGAVVLVAGGLAFLLFAKRDDEDYSFTRISTTEKNIRQGDHTSAQAVVPPDHVASQLDKLRLQAIANPADYQACIELANALFNVAAKDTRSGAFEVSRPKWEEALKSYAEALKLQDSPDVRCDLGTCYFNLGQYDEAQREFNTVITKDPQHANAAYNLGLVLEAKGDLPGAAKQWQALVDKQPATDAGKQAKANLERMHTK